jgi:hypothetical protein
MEYTNAPVTRLAIDGKVFDSPITTKADSLSDVADWAYGKALQRSTKTTRRPTPRKVGEEPTARIEALLTAQPLHRR